MKKVCSLILVVALAFSVSPIFSGCAKVEATDLMEGIKSNSVEVAPDMERGSEAATDFGVRLFQKSMICGSNTLISPLSVLYALTMTANGAVGETQEQMEQVIGMSIDEMTAFLYGYMNHLSQEKKDSMKIANSIWFADRDDFTPNQEFLQTNADYFRAALYKAPFDHGTLKDINQWVKQNTDGMIPEILDRINPNAVMYLVNALAFEAQWQEIYEDYQVRDGEFTLEDGTTQTAEFMYVEENRYLEDELATGFVKNYKNGDYAFVALLPKEGVTVEDYVSSLDGESLQNIIEQAQDIPVKTSIPQFKTGFSIELSDVLQQMGIQAAFDVNDANFSNLGISNDGNIFINRVLHKTHIEVTQEGTKAAAATAVEIREGAAEPPEDMKEVFLDRPFVYMLIDCENNFPFFIGTMMDVSK